MLMSVHTGLVFFFSTVMFILLGYNLIMLHSVLHNYCRISCRYQAFSDDKRSQLEDVIKTKNVIRTDRLVS